MTAKRRPKISELRARIERVENEKKTLQDRITALEQEEGRIQKNLGAHINRANEEMTALRHDLYRANDKATQYKQLALVLACTLTPDLSPSVMLSLVPTIAKKIGEDPATVQKTLQSILGDAYARSISLVVELRDREAENPMNALREFLEKPCGNPNCRIHGGRKPNGGDGRFGPPIDESVFDGLEEMLQGM